MNIYGTIQEILDRKGLQVWSVTPETTVFDAIRVMAKRNVGALVVLEEDRLAGIISERDYTRKVILKGKSSKETEVREIMTRKVVAASPEHSIEDGLRIMTEKKIRHLPIVANGKLVGIVSIGDLVNWLISAQRGAIHHLENYIAGTYPG